MKDNPNVPYHKLGQSMQRLLEEGKRPCYRIDGLRISAASATSVNPGALYVKTEDWDYIGKITPKGVLQIRNPDLITKQQKLLILEAINEPELTAMNQGKVTGTCCCCGRTLTNPLSIELGIGPICRGFWFPESTISTIEHTTIGEVIEHQEATDADIAIANKELDDLTENLGLPGIETTTQFSTEPVLAMVREFKLLNSTQQEILLHMLKTETESNDNL